MIRGTLREGWRLVDLKTGREIGRFYGVLGGPVNDFRGPGWSYLARICQERGYHLSALTDGDDRG